VQALGHEIEIELTGLMLFVVNEDQPGMIGHVGTILGEAGVNIASMAVSRNLRRGARALMICAIDDEPPAEVLEQVAAVPGIVDVRLIRLAAG
jgi:D-3-phosphoglycerate dehydrogenase